MEMSPTVRLLIKEMIEEEEGGFIYTNRRNDAGGPTFAGVTLRTYNDWRAKNGKLTYGEDYFAQSARTLHPSIIKDVYKIYFEEFLEPVYIGRLPQDINKIFFSCAVNAGVGGCGKIMQEFCNAKRNNWCEPLVVDGVAGPKTRAAMVNIYHGMFDWQEFTNKFVDAWIRYYINIAQENARKLQKGETDINQVTNLEGWFNRATKFRYTGVL